MNDVLDQIKSRRSVRKYKAEMPSKEVIEKIIEAGTYTATGMNRQSPIIIAVTNKEIRDRLSAANCKIGGWNEGFDPFYGAPAILIVLANKEMPTYIYDGSMVMDISCWLLMPKDWAAVGFIVQRKSLKLLNGKNGCTRSASRVNMRALAM